VEHDDDRTDAAQRHHALMIPAWCCPRCRTPLPAIPSGDEAIRCAGCHASYEVVAGIPDLRVPVAAWIDFGRDRAQARQLAALRDVSAERLAREVFQARPGWTEARVAKRTRQVIEGPSRARREIEAWLAPLVSSGGPILEIGCGTGGLLAALPADACPLGVDVSLAWLVVAQRLLQEHGCRAALAAAVAEALPLADASVRAVVALDVIEHVADPGPMLREIDRVAAAGAALALATPNRFSLAAEPHVGVWGVGWLPRRLQAPYVRWRTGQPYAFAKLLSVRETCALVRAHTRFDVKAEAPPIPHEEIAAWPARRAWLGRAYNALRDVPGTRAALLAVGAFFHVTGTRRR
jgi:LSD1 subclass zinc finger protein